MFTQGFGTIFVSQNELLIVSKKEEFFILKISGTMKIVSEVYDLKYERIELGIRVKSSRPQKLQKIDLAIRQSQVNLENQK